MSIVRLKATDGSNVEFEDKIIGQGGMKDVYFSPDRSYVVAFFRNKQDYNAKERLTAIAGTYRDRIFNQVGGEYWKHVFCWPTKVIEDNGRLGLIAPVYEPHFFFKYGSVDNDTLHIKGFEKEGKWFASALNQNRWLDTRERGNWLSYFRVCILTCRAVKRMHMAGLAHSDLSYKNVLIDPCGGNASIIDIDGLVVPGKYPPGVVGTPDFIAPEVMITRELPVNDPKKALPRRETDQHALAVLIYMYLLYRHPLRGRKINDPSDTEQDELLAMGERALFIENPKDMSNSYDAAWVKKNEEKRWKHLLPWWDLGKLPYTILGPYLSPLVLKSFVQGLHDPQQRPSADDWETALIKTVDLMQPCQNASCQQGWYVFDNSTRPACPFCGTRFKGQLPVLNLYSMRGSGSSAKYYPDNHRLMVYHNQYLYQWHANSSVFPNEKLTDSQKKPVGYFSFFQNNWCFVNQTLIGMKDMTENKEIPRNSMVVLTEGKQILLTSEPGGRLVQIQLVSA